jgi:hypothetical protein
MKTTKLFKIQTTVCLRGLLALAICCVAMLMSCTNEDRPVDPESPTLAKALVGEWISEIKVDEFMPDEADVEMESSVDGYILAFIYHFNDDGTCWKEINVMEEGKLIYQPVDRYSTSTCKYTIGQDGMVVIEYEGSEESDELYFDGTKLTEGYGDEAIIMQRATEEQIRLYREQSDAWHGGSAEKKYNVADYKPKGVDNSQWMKQLKDDRLVADVSLPGSHDACTAEGWQNPFLGIFDLTAKCQDLTIKEQLKAGVRVFDLRPEYVLDGMNYVLRCSHGMASTKMLVSDFFKTLKQFLSANTTEFCIVTVDLSNTRRKDAWGKDFNALVNSAEFKSMFADFKARLTVGEMRGKVLMLSKEVYAEKPLGGYCYGWVYDLELEKQQQGYITAADGSETPLWVQDYWKNITRDNKVAALVRMLEASVKRDMAAEKPVWVINYPSAYYIPFSDSYREIAESTNQKTIDWLSSHTGSVGIIYMDFAGMDESPDCASAKLYKTVGMKLVDAVIKQNFE